MMLERQEKALDTSKPRLFTTLDTRLSQCPHPRSLMPLAVVVVGQSMRKLSLLVDIFVKMIPHRLANRQINAVPIDLI